MSRRMLVDATHPEETRVVVVNGTRVEEFDFETSTKKQLKGNIYLARVTRVEPSLQAAFVEYGGNRHGFLAFSEIHPDYYRIPVADRQALIAAQAIEDDIEDSDRRGGPATSSEPPPPPLPAAPRGDVASLADALDSREGGSQSDTAPLPASADNIASVSAEPETPAAPTESLGATPAEQQPSFPWSQPPVVTEPAPFAAPAPSEEQAASPEAAPAADAAVSEEGSPIEPPGGAVVAVAAEPVVVESVGGDELEEVERRRRQRPVRHYKIQEVIKRRQILLVQVVKEERGTKGAALTTYLSLAGRYCVLMPNTARGGGISRRITNAQDRKRLKQIMEELQVPDGMAVILRTAGMERNNAEIKRDYEYLMRLWDDIRELTLHSVAPCLIYEEGNLVKRAIRDLYSSDIEEILVEGEAGYESARSFMAMLMPEHVERVRRYDDPAVPLFQRFQVENELDDIHSPSVRLRSGGYIVINQTEALVAIDVNSGRATRERHIEETALKTNLEAAEEVARQLRLRDLAGLIVIDFIDMEEHRNQHAVERRMKDAMRSDRARIQIGRISPFGLLELSRQRLRPSLAEVSSEICVHCGGTGRVRSTESAVLHVLRAVEEEGMKLRTAEATVTVPTAAALYMLNHKREALQRIETRYGLHVTISADDALIPPAFRLDRTKNTEGAAAPAQTGRALPPTPVRVDQPHGEPTYALPIEPAGDDERDMGQADARGGHEGEREGEEGGRGRGRRRRRRRGRGRDRHEHPGEAGAQTRPEAFEEHGVYPAEPPPEGAGPTPLIPPEGEHVHAEGHAPAEGAPHPEGAEGQGGEEHRGRRRRRRGRRGGRHRHGEGAGFEGGGFERGGFESNAPSGGPVPPVIIGPGHDLPPESPFAAPAPAEPMRVEGPGDAHDWPWNRRGERFPEDQPAAPEPAAPRHGAPRDAEPPHAAPRPEAPADEPAADEPKGPPRKGWWRRLTE
ncbi:MAG: ribonuclease E/G [Alphaproteobacteria bacterium]|nr:ribonuclease E/G [Alphaproteobacteria bacterium]